MSDDTLDTVRALLTSVLEETDDSELRYKLRTALQLLDVHRDNLTRLDDAADSDEDLRERLRDLGYID